MMVKLIGTFFLLFILHNVHTKGLRRNPDLWTFNTEVNANITAKIQDEAVIISIVKVKNAEAEPKSEYILFGFDIFNFVPQSFTVSVNPQSKKLFLNLTSTISSNSMEIDLKKYEKIETLFLRLTDEDDTVFVVLNCESSDSVVTPLNLIKFFRSVSMNKFKILFNKNYEMGVLTEDDDMEIQVQRQCNLYNVTNDSKLQIEEQYKKFSHSLIQYVPDLISVLKVSGKSEIATEIFIKSFLSKDVFHQTSNVYRLVHLIQSSMKSFPQVFQPTLDDLLTKIFLTDGEEFNFVRKFEANYNDDVSIKSNLLDILFANAPRTFMDSLRDLKDIGEKFRGVFANIKININQLMKNETGLKYILLDILFKEELDEDQLKLLGPTHIIAAQFAHYYLTDLSINPKILNDLHKRIIFQSDRQDYNDIAKFVRYIFIKESGVQKSDLYLESDLVIGMRIIYMLASGQVNEKKDIYKTIRNMITKKNVDLPTALEYPKEVITSTLNKCYLNPESSRYIFMHVLENLFVYNQANIGSYFDKSQGTFIYNLYRDLLLNDIQKENSALKAKLLLESSHLQQLIISIIQAVVENVDEVKELRQIAVDFVNDTLSYAKVDGSHILKSEQDYVTIFKKLVGEAFEVSKTQKIINYKITLLSVVLIEKSVQIRSASVGRAVSRIFPTVTPTLKQRLLEVSERYHYNGETLLMKTDEILREFLVLEEPVRKIKKQDLKPGAIFYSETGPEEPARIFQLDEDEDVSLKQERIGKLRELNILEDWYREKTRYDSTSPKVLEAIAAARPK